MGEFANRFGKLDVRKEMGMLKEKTGIDPKLLGLGVPEDKQLDMISKIAGDKQMTWLEKFSLPFKNAFKAALQYEKKRQIKVISEFFEDMAKIGHHKIKLHVKQADMRDHMVEFDDSGQVGGLNSQIVINGKTNQMKAKFALEAMKHRNYKTITVYLKRDGMKDHYVEVNDNGKKIPFLQKVKEL